MFNQTIAQAQENSNAIIKITYGDKPTVSGRELHEFLEVETPYRIWFPRMAEYGFTEGVDYTPYNFVHPQNQQETTDHQITIDMAKEISMIQRTDKGKQARQYFIQVEKDALSKLVPQPMSPLEIMRSMLDAQINSEKRIDHLEAKIQVAFEKPMLVDWSKWANDKINIIIESEGLNHQKYRGDLYAELEQTARCNLEARQTQLRRRMRESGHTVKECKDISKLHIINADPKLRSIFETIVRRESARCV
jgi:phage anti-repressor protein